MVVEFQMIAHDLCALCYILSVIFSVLLSSPHRGTKVRIFIGELAPLYLLRAMKSVVAV